MKWKYIWVDANEMTTISMLLLDRHTLSVCSLIKMNRWKEESGSMTAFLHHFLVSDPARWSKHQALSTHLPSSYIFMFLSFTRLTQAYMHWLPRPKMMPDDLPLRERETIFFWYITFPGENFPLSFSTVCKLLLFQGLLPSRNKYFRV